MCRLVRKEHVRCSELFLFVFETQKCQLLWQDESHNYGRELRIVQSLLGWHLSQYTSRLRYRNAFKEESNSLAL
jgi:hypothetical protein